MLENVQNAFVWFPLDNKILVPDSSKNDSCLFLNKNFLLLSVLEKQTPKFKKKL